MLVTLVALFIASASYADYSRDYIDTVPVKYTQSADTAIAYRVFNRGSDHPKLLLVMGLGGAGAAWGDDFIQRIEAQGFELMVIDNRDTGGSDLFTNWGTPTIWWQILKYELGFSVDAPYTLRDMASDSVAVLDAEGHDQVHVMGVSMGGMIAQVIAAQHPERVQTLTSIMSTTFAPHLPPPSRAAEDELRDLAGGDAELSREAKMRARGFHPESMERHLMAIFKSGDRTREVQTISAPTLVLHGSEDPLVPPAHGMHTAEQIEGSRFVLLDGMGHNLPDEFHDQIVGLMSEHIYSEIDDHQLNQQLHQQQRKHAYYDEMTSNDH
jgi:pimeloyl-ACP methyl ester carboxylesterase